MAIDHSGYLYGWGMDYYGQLGTGRQNEQETLPIKINLNNIMSIGCGSNHTIAVTSNNEIYAWGRNRKGQLGLGDNYNRGLPTLLLKF